MFFPVLSDLPTSVFVPSILLDSLAPYLPANEFYRRDHDELMLKVTVKCPARMAAKTVSVCANTREHEVTYNRSIVTILSDR
jgi:hypothetical protein